MADKDLYRGKSGRPIGAWYYGRLLADDVIVPKGESFYVVGGKLQFETDKPITAYMVRPETVGQCIGEEDMYMDRIFEGDIVSAYNRVLGTGKELYTVVWQDHGFFFVDQEETPWQFNQLDHVCIMDNIHDQQDDIELPF